jgi:hypothetical protein
LRAVLYGIAAAEMAIVIIITKVIKRLDLTIVFFMSSTF